MRRRNGIPIDIPSVRKQVQKVKTQKPAEYNKYKTFATMFKKENGQRIWATVPVAHPDFKSLKKEGFQIVEVWNKREATA